MSLTQDEVQAEVGEELPDGGFVDMVTHNKVTLLYTDAYGDQYTQTITYDKYLARKKNPAKVIDRINELDLALAYARGQLNYWKRTALQAEDRLGKARQEIVELKVRVDHPETSSDDMGHTFAIYHGINTILINANEVMVERFLNRLDETDRKQYSISEFTGNCTDFDSEPVYNMSGYTWLKRHQS